MTVAIILLVALLALLGGAGFYVSGSVVNGKRQTLEEARAWQQAHYDLSWYDGLEKEDYTVESFDGYVLHAQFLRNPAPSEKYVIISHGYTDNRFGSLKYGKIYLDLGYNLVIYDLRGHGLNAPTFCTYSIRERRDLAAMIADTKKRHPDAVTLGLHGESLGAATSVAVLEFKPPVDFVVADCGFAEIVPVLKGAMKGMKMPAWLAELGGIAAKVRYGYGFNEMRPIDSLAGNTIPMLFIHGAADTFITPDHSRRMQAATAGESELRLIDGAPHAASVLTAPGLYAEYVAAFLEKVESGMARKA